MSTDAIPTTDATTTPPPAAHGAALPQPDTQRSDAELIRELMDIEKQYPAPEKGSEIPDARWYKAKATHRSRLRTSNCPSSSASRT